MSRIGLSAREFTWRLVSSRRLPGPRQDDGAESGIEAEAQPIQVIKQRLHRWNQASLLRLHQEAHRPGLSNPEHLRVTPGERIVEEDKRVSPPERKGEDLSLTGTVILLVRPEPAELRDQPRDALLLDCWRLLFHAQVHRVLEDRWTRGDLTLKGIQESIQRIGEAEFRGACLVLRQEQLLLPPDDHRTTYIEFAAVYLELRYFAATLLPSYFPSLRNDEHAASWSTQPTSWLRQLVAAVDADDLFRRTRLPDAPMPSPPAETASEEPIAYFRRLVHEADDATSHGNVVRGAIRRTEAARVAPAADEPRTLSSARDDVDALVARTIAVLGTTAEAAPRWKRVLLELLDKSDQGPWPQEARLLYDLQQACVSGEQEVRRVSVLRWIRKTRLRRLHPAAHQPD